MKLSLFKSDFSRNILTLMMGTSIAQAIPIAVSPILTRIYTPDDFGVLALFMAIIGILVAIISGRYELAIMLPEKDEDAINVLALGFLITCVMTISLILLVLTSKDYLVTLLDNQKIEPWLYFIPITVFFSGSFNLLNYFNVRKKNYKEIRNTTIVKSLILTIIQIAVGFFKQGVLGLVSGEILSRMFANMRLLKCILEDKEYISAISGYKIIFLAKKYKRFPILNLPSTFTNTLTQQLPFFMMPKLFSITINGYFSLAQKIIALPSALIARSISQVYFQKISENNKNKNKNLPLLKRTIRSLFLITLPIVVMIVLFSTEAFALVFGENWRTSGEIAKYLAVVFMFSFIPSTLSITLIAYEKLKHLAMWQFFYFLSSVIFYALSFFWGLDFKDFLFYFMIHECVIYLIYLALIISTVIQSDNLIIEG